MSTADEEATNVPPSRSSRDQKTSRLVFAFLILYKGISFYYPNALFRPPSNRPVLSGLCDVETFAQNGSEQPPLSTDLVRWKSVTIGDPPTMMHVQMMDASSRDYKAEYDKQGRSVTLFVGNDR